MTIIVYSKTSDHCPIACSLPIKKDKQKQVGKKHYIDYKNFKMWFQQQNFDIIYQSKDVDFIVDRLSAYLSLKLVQVRKKIEMKTRNKPWVTKGIKRAMQTTDKLNKKLVSKKGK